MYNMPILKIIFFLFARFRAKIALFASLSEGGYKSKLLLNQQTERRKNY
jgi:hypothetical protein